MDSSYQTKNRSCNNTATIRVSIYKSSIEVLSFMKFVELKITPCTITTSKVHDHQRFQSASQDNGGDGEDRFW